MSQSSSVNAAPPGGLPAGDRTGSALAPRNWRVASRLIVLVAIPRGAGAGARRAAGHGRDAQRRRLRPGRPARGARPAGHRLGAGDGGRAGRHGCVHRAAAARPRASRPCTGSICVTDGWAATVRRLVRQLGRGYPAQTRASASAVLASIAELPGLRRQRRAGPGAALAVINGYSAAIAGLFTAQRRHRRPERQLHAHHRRAGARRAVQDDGPCLAAAGHPRRGARPGPLRARRRSPR